MKNMKCRTAVIFLISAVITFNAKAQIVRETAGGRYIITIENNSAALTNVTYLDSVGPGDEMVHFFSFGIGVTDEKNLVELLNKIQSAYREKTAIQCRISALTFDYNIGLERTYNDVTIRDIILEDIDASSRDVFNIRILCASTSLKIGQGSGKYSLPIGSKMKKALCSNYKLTLGKLPAVRVNLISNLKITTRDEYGTVFISLSSIDAREWYDEMVSAAQSHATMSGVITMLWPDLKGEIMKIFLENVQIVSYKLPASTSENVSVIVGIRSNDVHFQF